MAYLQARSPKNRNGGDPARATAVISERESRLPVAPVPAASAAVPIAAAAVTVAAARAVVVAAGTTVLAAAAARRRTRGLAALGSATLTGREERLAREADLAGGVDVHDLHQHLVAFLDLAAHVLHAVRGHLGDVQEAVG